MIKNQKISVIIPVRNEESSIADVIKSIPQYVDEVIVVNNGSTDNTVAISKSAGAIVLDEPRTLGGIGYGYAHITGINHASGDFVVALDGDGTYPANRIREIVEDMINSNIDFVSCSRYPLMQKSVVSKIRQFGVKVLNLEVRILYNYNIQDTLSGMWVFKRDVKDLLSLTMGDWNFSPEIKLSAIMNPLVTFKEVHIEHFDRIGDSVQNIWKTGLSHLLYILTFRLRYGFLGKVRNIIKKKPLGVVLSS